MCSRKAVLFLAAVLVLLDGVMPQTAGAVDVIVEQNPTAISGHFASINQAIIFANNIVTTNVGTTVSYQVVVEPGTYPEAVSLVSNISVIGRETARTILSGGVTASGVTNVNFQHFTIINAPLGISVSNNSSVNITNNVFQGTLNNTAILIQNPQSTQTQVINNTFYQNGVALSADGQSLTVENNIFNLNGTAISQGVLSTSTILNNAFFLNSVDGPKGTAFIPNGITVTLLDPLFVDPSTANRDFHLKVGSPCIGSGASTINNAAINGNAGGQSDIGAYGGPNEDVIPFPVSGVSASRDPADPTAVHISWNPNNSYLIGGYRIWYGKSTRVYDGTGAAEGDSGSGSLDLTTTGTTTFTLTNLSSPTVAPGAPTQNPPQVQNEALLISWSPAAGATAYKVYHSIYSSTPPNCFDANSLPAAADSVDSIGNQTSHPLTGLTNGQKYCVAVSGVAGATYFIAVTAFNEGGDGATGVDPGKSVDSFYSNEATVDIGTPLEGGISNVIVEFPEALVPFPDLPTTRRGCFIATAAYGHYSAEEVQSLRKFRDRYLLTNRAGSAFVRWYYTYGPHAAAWLNAHPAYKPLVRTALYPAVGMAFFMTEMSLTLRAGMLIIAFLIAASMYCRLRRMPRSGGLR